jgi:foldase protein PrsA
VTKVIRLTSALGAVLFAATAIAACGGVPGNAVVQVGSEPITKTAFEHWMGIAAEATNSSPTPGAKPVIPVPPKYTACIQHLKATHPTVKGQAASTEAQLKAQCEQQYKSTQQEVLGFLISSSWVLNEANSLGVKVSDKEIKKKFEQLKTQEFPKPAEFEKFLASSGQTVSDLLLRVKLNALSQKIQQKVVKGKNQITEAQIQKYYKEHQSQFGTPEKRGVQLLLTKDEATAKKAKQEIESGKSFESVAKSVSTGALKETAGKVTEIQKGQENKALEEAVFGAQVSALGGPVKTPFGYYVYKVTKKTPGTQQSLASAKTTIKQQLQATQQQAALSKFVNSFKTKWTGKTECRDGFVVQDCKEYKAPKGSTGGTTGVS